MSCPRCGSNNLWDDNLWWGCNDCGYAAGPDGGTMIFAKDKPGLARNLSDIPGSGPGIHNMPYLVPNEPQNDSDDDGWND
jgi:hypothetical protein